MISFFPFLNIIETMILTSIDKLETQRRMSSYYLVLHRMCRLLWYIFHSVFTCPVSFLFWLFFIFGFQGSWKPLLKWLERVPFHNFPLFSSSTSELSLPFLLVTVYKTSPTSTKRNIFFMKLLRHLSNVMYRLVPSLYQAPRQSNSRIGGIGFV